MLTRLSSVKLVNFRGFKDHTVELTPTSVLIGMNNAGKSTFIDALRILAIAVRRAAAARYLKPPDWLDDVVLGMGYRISFETVDFDFENLKYNQNRSDPAQLRLNYSNDVAVNVWLGNDPSENFCQVIRNDGSVATKSTIQDDLEVPSIYVLPPVRPLIPHEKGISPARIEEYRYGRLASKHFRNQLYEKTSIYRAWDKLLRETWPSVAVVNFDKDVGVSNKELSMIMREGPVVSEAAWVGGGLQAWMQILWFLCQTSKKGVIVLDEPDVYLHADMQRKLIKLLGDREHRQIVIATHSTEIISDTPLETITVITKREKKSYRPSSKSRLQSVIDSWGGRHNIQLGKLAESKKIIVFEGADQKFFSEVAFKISLDSYDKFTKVPNFELGGVTNYHQAVGAAKALSAASDGSMPVHVVIDRDYHSDSEIKKIEERAERDGITMHVLAKKEVENYFLNAAAISRLIGERSNHSPSASEIKAVIETLATKAKEQTLDAITDKWHQENKRKSASQARKQAKSILTKLLKDRELVDLVSGKRLISLLSAHCKNVYGVSFGAMTLCKNMKINEFNAEMVKLVEKLS